MKIPKIPILNQIIQILDDFFSANEEIIILQQKEKLLKQEIEYEESQKRFEYYKEQLDKAISDLEVEKRVSEALQKELEDKGKHSTLEIYKEWLFDNLQKTTIKYDWRGRGREEAHTYFAECLKHKEVVMDFVYGHLKFRPDLYSTADKMVEKFNDALSDKYPTSAYYDSDDNLYGRMEYWATPNKTIAKLLKGKKGFDCDDSMGLRYTAIYYLLQEYFPEDTWRIRGFIIDLWTGGGHAMLGWVASGVNDWIPIETTFYDTKDYKIWQMKYRINHQMLYQIRYSFDNVNEYKRYTE